MNKIKMVAHIGHNHDGSEKEAEKLVQQAIDCGADAVTVYHFDPAAWKESEKFERFVIDNHRHLADMCHQQGREFWIAPNHRLYDYEYADRIYLPEGEVLNKPLLRYYADCTKPMTIDVSGSHNNEISSVVKIIPGISLGYGPFQFPSEIETTNLRRLIYLMGQYMDNGVGFVNTTPGISVCLLAMAYNPDFILTKFSTKKDSVEGAYSLQPEGFSSLISVSRIISKIVDNDGSALHAGEIAARQKLFRIESCDYLLPSKG